MKWTLLGYHNGEVFTRLEADVESYHAFDYIQESQREVQPEEVLEYIVTDWIDDKADFLFLHDLEEHVKNHKCNIIQQRLVFLIHDTLKRMPATDFEESGKLFDDYMKLLAASMNDNRLINTVDYSYVFNPDEDNSNFHLPPGRFKYNITGTYSVVSGYLPKYFRVAICFYPNMVFTIHHL